MSLASSLKKLWGSETYTDIRNRLLEKLQEEERRALEKMANRDYWRNVGDLEMAAVKDIRACILIIPQNMSASAYGEQAARALDELAAQWRNKDEDEDGYGVATVHAVGRVLPDYYG